MSANCFSFPELRPPHPLPGLRFWTSLGDFQTPWATAPTPMKIPDAAIGCIIKTALRRLDHANYIRYSKFDCHVVRLLARLTTAGESISVGSVGSCGSGDPIAGGVASWDRLTSGAGGRHACGEGQQLQWGACCKCSAKPKSRDFRLYRLLRQFISANQKNAAAAMAVNAKAGVAAVFLCTDWCVSAWQVGEPRVTLDIFWGETCHNR